MIDKKLNSNDSKKANYIYHHIHDGDMEVFENLAKIQKLYIIQKLSPPGSIQLYQADLTTFSRVLVLMRNLKLHILEYDSTYSIV